MAIFAASAQSASKADSTGDQIVFTKEEMMQMVQESVCSNYEKMAANIATRRQNGETMADTLFWLNQSLGFEDQQSEIRSLMQGMWDNKYIGGDPKLQGKIYLKAAFALPKASSEQAKNDMILEFRNQAFSNCM